MALQNHALKKDAFEKKVLAAVKEAQHSQNELVKVRADANIICVELQSLKSRLNDIGGGNVYSCNRQQGEENLEMRLQEARDELAEMTSCLNEAKRYLKEAKAKAWDEIKQLEATQARVEELEGENGKLVTRAEKSEKATKAAPSSGSAHTDVWD